METNKTKTLDGLYIELKRRESMSDFSIPTETVRVYLDEVYAELYASEENRKKDEPEPFGYVVGTDFFPRDSTLIDEVNKQLAEIVRENQTNQSQQPASVAWLSDDTVSLRMEFENEVKVNKDGISVLFETSNQHYIEWLEKRIKLQQHVSIQWFTDDEIFERCPIAYCNQAHIEAKRLGAIWLQSELRKRVIDPVDFAIWFHTNAVEYMRGGTYVLLGDSDTTYSASELLQIYINSKTKDNE